jgi:hypothetical protein
MKLTRISDAERELVAMILSDIVDDRMSISEIMDKYGLDDDDYKQLVKISIPIFRARSEAERWRTSFRYLVKKVKEYGVDVESGLEAKIIIKTSGGRHEG